MITTTINKDENGRTKKVLADNGISYSLMQFSASDLADILISKGIISEADIK